MALNPSNTAPNPWYREPWPWILMAGPFAVIVAGVVTVWLAVRTNDGLVAEDYYKQGLAVNQVLEREHQAEKLGLRADVMRAGDQLRVLVGGGSGYSVPTTLKLKLMRPTRAGEDQTIELRADSQGFFSGRLKGDVQGRWIVSLEDATGTWRLYGHWHADGDNALRLVPGELTTESKKIQGREPGNGVGTAVR